MKKWVWVWCDGPVQGKEGLKFMVCNFHGEPCVVLATPGHLGYVISMWCWFSWKTPPSMGIHVLQGSRERPWPSRGSSLDTSSAKTQPSCGPAWPRQASIQGQAVRSDSSCILSPLTWFSFLHQLLLTQVTGSISSSREWGRTWLPGTSSPWGAPWACWRTAGSSFLSSSWCRLAACDALFHVLFTWKNEAREGESHIVMGHIDDIFVAIVKSIKDKGKQIKWHHTTPFQVHQSWTLNVRTKSRWTLYILWKTGSRLIAIVVETVIIKRGTTTE